MEYIEVGSFEEIEATFLERVGKVVWCSVATLDRRNRLRSRILHTIWDGPTGWIATRRHTLKSQHLEHHPYVSLAYIADVANPVYVDCRAEWDDRLESKQRVWDMFLVAAPPLGYDPAPIFVSPDHADFGVLKLTPWRIELAEAPVRRLVWHNPRE